MPIEIMELLVKASVDNTEQTQTRGRSDGANESASVSKEERAKIGSASGRRSFGYTRSESRPINKRQTVTI